MHQIEIAHSTQSAHSQARGLASSLNSPRQAAGVAWRGGAVRHTYGDFSELRADIWARTVCTPVPVDATVCVFTHYDETWSSDANRDAVALVRRNHDEYAASQSYSSCSSTWKPRGREPTYARFPVVFWLLAKFEWVLAVDFDTLFLDPKPIPALNLVDADAIFTGGNEFFPSLTAFPE